MSTISLAGFKVYGSAIVEMARDMVLAGEWAKALNTFEENLEGLSYGDCACYPSW